MGTSLRHYQFTVCIPTDLSEEIFLAQPLAFAVAAGALVCRLQNSLYGVKQVQRAWREKRNEIMAKLSFRAALTDSSV
jgi:hypothetical protein